MTLFVIKKIVTPFFYPLSIITLIFIVGFLLHFRRSFRRLGKVLIVFGFILLLVSSLEPITDRLVAKLEKKYSPLTEETIKKLPPVKYICVLGGGTNPDPAKPYNSQLSRASLARLLEAVRLHRHWPEARLIVSGGAVFTHPPEGEIMAELANMLSVPKEKIIVEGKSRDTSDQAALIKPIVKDNTVIVVTSAIHMPRSILLFQRSGIRAIPAPTDYLTAEIAPNPIKRFFPSPDSVLHLEMAIHEILGLTRIKIFR